MSDISVDVTVARNGEVTYKSSSAGVETDGTITIEAGEDATITFAPTSGQTWQFQSPWVAIAPVGGAVSLVSGTEAAVVVRDNNSQPSATTYDYCLETTLGTLDPRLINKGT
jgi:hypothetical protein